MRILIALLLFLLSSCSDIFSFFWPDLECTTHINIYKPKGADSLYVEVFAGDSLIYSKSDTNNVYWFEENRDIDNFNWTVNMKFYWSSDSTENRTINFFVKRHSNTSLYILSPENSLEQSQFFELQYDNFCDD